MEEPVFILGMMFGALLLFAAQTLLRGRRALRSIGGHARRADPDEFVSIRERELKDLHARLAVLERITTDPAARTAAEIETLR